LKLFAEEETAQLQQVAQNKNKFRELRYGIQFC
jgi:hypothetical protein